MEKVFHDMTQVSTAVRHLRRVSGPVPVRNRDHRQLRRKASVPAVIAMLGVGLVGVTMNPAMAVRVQRVGNPGPLVNSRSRRR